MKKEQQEMIYGWIFVLAIMFALAIAHTMDLEAEEYLNSLGVQAGQEENK